MNKNWIIVIIFLILVLLVLHQLIFVEPYDGKPMYRYEDIKKFIKTGDIILFSCKYHGSFFDKLLYGIRTNLLGSEYGHAGVALKDDDDRLYIIECCGPTQCGYQNAYYLNKEGKGGARIVDLDTILREYYKEYQGIYAVKFISKKIPNSLVLGKLKKYETMTFRERQVMLKLALTDIVISHNLATDISKKCDDRQMICTEFLYDLLYECGIVSEYPSKLFWPHLITNGKFDKLDKIKYSDYVKFTIADNHN